MKPLTNSLLLCLALALTNGAPTPPPPGTENAGALPDRCQGIEFDAIVLDEKGSALFFKDEYLWNGYHGAAQHSNESFMELDDVHGIGHVDAAFRMHNPDNAGDHDHIYFFLDDKVFSYYNHTLEEGYPKSIQEDFPQVPTHLDAAVECPKGECVTDSVLFFKGHDVHVYDIATKTVKAKTWSHLPACTSALRWLEHYYCFHGNNFTRFHPITGEVNGPYPKDARRYFMRCADFGHGGGYQTPKCSELKIDAITSDDAGKTYFFAGLIYARQDTSRDGIHTFPITRGWKEVMNGVDAVFSYAAKLYMIKDDQVFIYKGDAHYSLIEGYPKSLQEELSIEGHVDAAFVCPNENTVHVIQGQNIRDIDLVATPRVVTQEVPLMLSGIDAALCGSDGIKLYKGPQFYHYDTMASLTTSSQAQQPQDIPGSLFGCQN